MDWKFTFDHYQYVAAEKEQEARREALANEARKERETHRLRYDR